MEENSFVKQHEPEANIKEGARNTLETFYIKGKT
jgi:hypothetical protein